MKKKFILQVVAWLLTIAMLLPSANIALTAYAAEGKAAYSSSVTFSDSSWWTEKEVTQKDLLGSIDPEDVSYIKFYSDTTFNIGYGGVSADWVIGENQTSYTVSDIRWTDMMFKFGLSKNDGVMYTIKWDVYTGDAKPAEDKKDEAAGEVINMTTQINESWGVYTNTISVSTLEKYKDGVTVDVDFTVDKNSNYGLIGPVDAGNSWAKLVSYCTGKFDSDDGAYMVFGSDGKNASFTLSAAGVKEVVKNGGGLILQGYAVNITKVTLTGPVAADPTATPTPTATPKPTATPTPTPVVQYTEGDVLTVTKDMVNKNGTVTLKNGIYNEVIVPADVAAAKVVLERMYADLLVIEGGAAKGIDIRSGEIDKVIVKEPVVEAVDYKKLVENGMEIGDALKVYSKYQDAKEAAEKAVVSVKTGELAKIKTLEVRGNASLNLEKGKVDEVVLTTEYRNDNMAVAIDGHTGNLFVNIDKKNFKGNGNLRLDLGDSQMDDVVISGGAVSLGVDSGNASADTVVLENAANVSLGLDATNVLVSEKTTDAEVRLYGNIGTVTVDGDRNIIILPAYSKVGNAVVNGDKVRIYGYGRLPYAVVNGEGANVATLGTTVEGDNDTTTPNGMIAMGGSNYFNGNTVGKPISTPVPTQVPLEDAVYANGGAYMADNDWWAQYSISQADLIGDVDPADIDHITFWGEANIKIAYNPVGDSNWVTTDDAKKVTVNGSDVELYDSFNIIMRSNSLTKEEVYWRVYTTPAEEEEPATVVTIEGNDGWATTTLSKSELLAGNALEDVESFTFSCDTSKFQVGYNCAETQSWKQHDDVAEPITIPAADINWDSSAYYFQLGLGGASGTEYVISWTVNLKETAGDGEQEEEEVIHNFAYTTDDAGYVKETYKFKLNEYLEDVAQNDVVKITVVFSSDANFGGEIQGNIWNEEAQDGKWGTVVAFSGSGTFEGTMEVPYGAGYNEMQVQMWWMNESATGVDIESITVERVEDTTGGDTETDTETATGSALTVLFSDGAAEEGWGSSDASWLLNAADDAVITVVCSADAGKEGWGIGGWYAKVDGGEVSFNNINADGTDATKEATVTITAAELKAELGITDSSTVEYLSIGTWNTGKIILLSIQ